MQTTPCLVCNIFKFHGDFAFRKAIAFNLHQPEEEAVLYATEKQFRSINYNFITIPPKKKFYLIIWHEVSCVFTTGYYYCSNYKRKSEFKLKWESYTFDWINELLSWCLLQKLSFCSVLNHFLTHIPFFKHIVYLILHTRYMTVIF